jgi:hypothetical protein
MSAKKVNYFGDLNTSTLVRFSLDKSKYANVDTVLGLSTAVPAGNKDVVALTLGGAKGTGKFQLIRVRAVDGIDSDTQKSRTVTLVCEVAKLATATSALIGKTMSLGNVSGGVKTWTIEGISG